MAKFYVMGNYSAQAFQGFVKDPGQDRGKAVEAISQAMGWKVHSFDIVRGPVDFVAVVEADSFTNVAAIKLAVEASGSISNMTICEAIDIKSAAACLRWACACHLRHAQTTGAEEALRARTVCPLGRPPTAEGPTHRPVCLGPEPSEAPFDSPREKPAAAPPFPSAPAPQVP